MFQAKIIFFRRWRPGKDWKNTNRSLSSFIYKWTRAQDGKPHHCLSMPAACGHAICWHWAEHGCEHGIKDTSLETGRGSYHTTTETRPPQQALWTRKWTLSPACSRWCEEKSKAGSFSAPKRFKNLVLGGLVFDWTKSKNRTSLCIIHAHFHFL